MRINKSLAIIGSLQFRLAGPLDSNVYAIRGPEGLVLIDSGAGTHTELLLRNLREDLGTLPVAAVILTHCHADHAAGAAAIRALTGCRIFAPDKSRKLLEAGDEDGIGLRAARDLGMYPSEFRFTPCPIDRVLLDGQPMIAGGITFYPIHVCGHSLDAYCLLTQVDNAAWFFSGDVVFYGGLLGLINAEGSEMAGFRRDLPKLATICADSLFPGHGLFTLQDGQRHIECALQQLKKGFISRQIGQGDLIF